MIEKVELKGTYGYKNFITDNEKNELVEWAISNQKKFTPNRDNRAYYTFNNPTSVTDLIVDLKERIIQLESITDWKEEPVNLDYIGINSKGGFIHLHLDSNDGEYIHTRYNVILSYPDEGGESIYGDNTNILEENMVWKCVAGKVKHGSNVVKGDKKRITLSLGFLIKE
jgi:hypothetical protein